MTTIDPLEAALDGRPYQRVAERFIAQHRNVLIADQPGLGKTIEILAGIRASWDRPIRVLILCPRVAVTSVWANEIRERIDTGQVTVCALQGLGSKRENSLAHALETFERFRETTFVIGNIEMARIKPLRDEETQRVKWLTSNALYPDLFSIVWDVIVVDESDRALICKSRKQDKWSQQYAGMKKLRAKQRIAASGTPMRGKPEQLWGTLNWLRPEDYTSYWRWVGKYFANEPTLYSQFVIGPIIDPKAYARDLATIMLRRTKAEVLPELPPIQYAGHHLIPGDDQSPHGVWLDMDTKQATQYRRMVKDGVVTGEAGELLPNGILAENARKMQLASAGAYINDRGELTPLISASNKFEWLLQKVYELNGERLIVASKFTRLIDAFAAGLRDKDIACHVLTGKVTSDRKRTKMREDFQSADPSASVFLLNTKAGGVALTLDMADYGVGLDETGNPDDRTQVEGRLHRTSRIHQVTWYQLYTLDTIEEELAYVAAAKYDVQAWLMDGTRGVDHARRLYEERRANTLSKKS